MVSKRVKGDPVVARVKKFTSQGPLDWRKLKPPPWVLPGVIREGHIMLLTGEPGTGKSVFAGAVGLCGATGRSFIGNEVTTRARVAYLGLDAAIDDYYYFLPRIAKGMGLEAAKDMEFTDDYHFRMLHTQEPFDIRQPKKIDSEYPMGWDLAALMLAADREVFPHGSEDEEPYISRPNLVILDCLRSIHAGEENASEEMSLVMTRLRALANTGISIIIIHHEAKPGQNGTTGTYVARGSSVISASIDSHLRLKSRKSTTPRKKDVLAAWVKGRGADLQESFAYRMTWDEEVLVFEGKKVDARGEAGWHRIENQGLALSWNDIAKATGAPGVTMKRTLSERGWKKLAKGMFAPPPPKERVDLPDLLDKIDKLGNRGDSAG